MIPKKIHYCWLSDNPLPELTQKCLTSWKEKLPDYEIILWDLNKFDINSTQWTKESFESKKSESRKAILRRESARIRCSKPTLISVRRDCGLKFSSSRII